MMNKLNINNKFLYTLVSILFGVILLFSSSFGDDLYLMHYNDVSFIDSIKKAIELTNTWSSRVLINSLVIYFNDNHPLLWAITMAFSMYILLYSLDKLFNKDKAPLSALFIITAVFLIPFNLLASAGWISTTVTYFVPIAFCFLSLIPIKKCLTSEKYMWYEYIIYCLAIIIACNQEQVSILVLLTYIVACIYFIVNKKKVSFIYIQLILALLSFIYIVFCPGNWSRESSEIANWFPTYGMLNIFNKFDICFSTTMKWLFFENNFICFACLVLTILTFKKYSETSIRIISLLPTVITAIGGPLNSIVSLLFPYISNLNNKISVHGLVTAVNRGNLEVFMTYSIWCLLLICLLVTVIKLANSFKTLLITLTLLIAGLASRFAIMFSPTIYASGYRTCLILVVCVLVTILILLFDNLDRFKNKKILSYISIVLIILNIINFIYVVATTIN